MESNEQPHISPESGAAHISEFLVSDSAAARINALKQKKGDPNLKFRVSVAGGGCSGFQYIFDLDGTPAKDDDRVFSHNGADVIIDSTSLEMVAKSTLDFTEDLSQAGFEIKNPQATANCGCGNSFSIPL